MTLSRAIPPSFINQPDNKLFRKNDFDAVIFQKGYSIILEQAVACPCRGRSGESRPNCQNCMGIGWIFMNPLQTKAILTSINYNTKYKEWSPELTGTISVTLRDIEKISFFDKITLVDGMSTISEVKPLVQLTEDRFIFCSYKVEKINFLLVFISENQKLMKLTEDDFEIVETNKFIIKIKDSVVLPPNFNGGISVDYDFHPSYNIIDIPHDIRASFIVNHKGQFEEIVLPVQGVARRSHIILGESTNYSGDNLLDNNV